MTEDRIAELIGRTLENAALAPYYQRAFGDRWKSVRTIEELATLPLIDKATAIRNQRDLIVGDPPPGFGIASSGTTRALDLPALNVRRTKEELAAIHGEASASEPDPNDPHPGWTMVAIGVHHGLPIDDPAPDEIRIPWTYHRNSLSMMEAVLSEPQPDGRFVTAMRISAGALKTLTLWLVERGFDFTKLSVRLIGTNGARVSPHWREFIGAKFQAEIYDNFSLSEFPTAATECKACGALHFGWPPMLYEVLDLASNKPIDTGIGKLVLTSLYPWVQKMPLIRYDTGDVVEIGEPCPQTNEPMVRPLGRLRRGLVLPIGTFVLAPSAVQDVLESLPDTERNPHPAVTSGLIRSKEIGLPRWTVELEGSRARLRFETKFDPWVYADRARELEAMVSARIFDEDPGLAGSGVTLEVIACAPGSLSPPGDKFE
jgi:hypothetical protein